MNRGHGFWDFVSDVDQRCEQTFQMILPSRNGLDNNADKSCVLSELAHTGGSLGALLQSQQDVLWKHVVVTAIECLDSRIHDEYRRKNVRVSSPTIPPIR